MIRNRLIAAKDIFVDFPTWQKVFFLLFAFIMFLTIFGPWIGPYDPIQTIPSDRLTPPSWAHPFGVDDNGMDVFSRILASPRIDVTIAVVAVILAVLIGVPLGLVIAALEQRPEKLARFCAEIAMRVLEVVQAFPVFVLAMVLVAVAGGSIMNIVVAVAFVNAPVFVRLARSEVSALLLSPFVEAAKAIGCSDLRIGFRHILPNIIPTIIVQISVTAGFAILLTAGLSFVGAGVKPPAAELGSMIAAGSKFIQIGHWWVVIFPSVALGIIVFTFAVVGDTIRTLLHPVTENRGQTNLGDTATNFPAIETMVTEKSGNIAPVLDVSNLSVAPKRAPDQPILDQVNFQIFPGEKVAIIGESGAGKTMLANAILRILPHNLSQTSGTCLFQDQDIGSFSEKELREKRSVEIAAVLPNAKSQLYPLNTIEESLLSVIHTHESLSRDQAHARCIELLTMVGINDPEQRLKAYPHELSGGMAQRVCLAIALMHGPKLLVADEPTQGLDVTIQRQILDTIIEMTNETESALVIITGDLGIAAHYADRILVMKDGRLVEANTRVGFFDEPQSDYSKELLHSVQA